MLEPPNPEHKQKYALTYSHFIQAKRINKQIKYRCMRRCTNTDKCAARYRTYWFRVCVKLYRALADTKSRSSSSETCANFLMLSAMQIPTR